MRACPDCALELPDHARFCARCGARLPGEPAPRGGAAPAWLLVLFLLGVALSALVALLYAAALAAPDLGGAAAGNGVSVPELRVGSAIVTLLAAAMFVLQLVATIGLLRRRRWGRAAATVACVAWALTCVGIPFSILALNALWRTPSGRPTTMGR